MALFGESKAERAERELRQEIENLRQEIKSLKEEGSLLENKVDDLNLKVCNDKKLLTETMSGLSALREKYADLKSAFVNFSARAKRKRLQMTHSERTKK